MNCKVCKIILTSTVLLLFSCSFHVFSCTSDTLHKIGYSGNTKTKIEIFSEKYLYGGFGVGPETGISLFFPKVSFYNFHDRKNLSTYYGIEGVLGVFFADWYSVDCLYGVKKNKFTIDTSIGVWWHSDIGFHSTLNPKLGVKFWKMWLKAGPSIYLYRNYLEEQKGIGNFPKIGNMCYNFELLIKL